jgi:hypothetical protein
VPGEDEVVGMGEEGAGEMVGEAALEVMGVEELVGVAEVVEGAGMDLVEMRGMVAEVGEAVEGEMVTVGVVEERAKEDKVV